MLRITLWLLALGALLLAFRAIRLRATASSAGNPRPAAGDRPRAGIGRTATRGRWHSVSIECEFGCEAAMALDGQRFLPAEAPGIPVPGCDRPSCSCRYVRHDDRRQEDERRFAFGTFGGLIPRAGGTERREAGDRRNAQKPPD